MRNLVPVLPVLVVLASIASVRAAEHELGSPPWRIVIANDTCPDVTWGCTEAEVRSALADLIRGHLDEMNRTDAGPAENRNHYNLMAFVEAESFFEKYPERKGEFVRRAREGRIALTPFLCNTLWGMHSVEATLRSFYPAHRFAREHGIPFDVANHTELPSLPWGIPTILAGAGFRWVNVPFLHYDTTFAELQNPPLFRLEGPDGSQVRVVLDKWASMKANYTQGGYLLQDPQRVAQEWLPHYEELGELYPLRTILASGTHSDINPDSWRQARVFADGIAAYNAVRTNPAKLVNGTLAQFCREVDSVEQSTPFLPVLRGCFGHSWELWPVSLADLVAKVREQERRFLAAESLVALASRTKPDCAVRTRAARQRAEWCWAMLGDHAWNGTDLENKRHNAELRRRWVDELAAISSDLTAQAWRDLGLQADPDHVTVFNPLSFADDILVAVEVSDDITAVDGLTSTVHLEDGKRRLAFVAPHVPPFGFRQFQLLSSAPPPRATTALRGDVGTLAGPFYRLRANLQHGGLDSLVHLATGQELVLAAPGRSLGQTVFFDGQEHTLSEIECTTHVDDVAAELHMTGRAADLRVTTTVTLYAEIDRVDFEVRVDKSPTTQQQRLLHFFPVSDGADDVRIETPAAVLRPLVQPKGDLLPGADTRRFAVQGFVDVSPAARSGVTIVPLDAYMLRLDQGTLAFEALGNDQNWKEVTQDQGGVSRFRFRYALRAHSPGYDQASAVAWSRSVVAPLAVISGQLPAHWLDQPHLTVDPACAIATCFKPSDDGDSGKAVVRLWQTGGQAPSVWLHADGYKAAKITDLLEREQSDLVFEQGAARVPIRTLGMAGVVLEP